MRFLLPTLLASVVLVAGRTSHAAPPSVLGGMQLLDGYEHQPLQGIDSVVGRIVRKDGFTISYEKGRIPDPNARFRLGGDFSNAAQRTPADRREWYREQTVNGVPVHMVLQKDQQLIVTFPKSGINFRAKIEKPSDLADVLVQLLTFPNAPAEK